MPLFYPVFGMAEGANKIPNADNLWGGHALLYGTLAHLDAECMWDCAMHGLDLAPFAASLLVP